MILTCPSCGTQYAVKDGAIPPGGRQVRCASCKHAWHQDPEQSNQTGEASQTGEIAHIEQTEQSVHTGQAEAADDSPREESIAEAAMIEPRTGPEAEERAYIEASLAADPAGAQAPHSETVVDEGTPAPVDEQGLIEEQRRVEEQRAAEQRAPAQRQWTPPADPPTRHEALAPAPVDDDDFSPFTLEDRDRPRHRSPVTKVLMTAVLIAALAAAFWFLAPPEWKERVGIAAAGETPLQLMMTHSDRQRLASGNELLAVSGRVINPTDEQQNVPPIRAQLRSSSGKLVYSWTIAPPARILPPGASATFNSAEVNVPAGGDELTITLGSAKT
jgi:predicted Zn finger-like uncharacterized protein